MLFSAHVLDHSANIWAARNKKTGTAYDKIDLMHVIHERTRSLKGALSFSVAPKNVGIWKLS